MNDGVILTIEDVWEDVVALINFPGEFIEVQPGMPLSQRFQAIKHNYRRKQAMVDSGIDDWFRSDPYEVAYWPALFTPIEAALWSDIRRWSLDLWPQLPVGRFFVDFGNPIARIAVECDGVEWHKDKEKDCRRDQTLFEMGWEVVRIPGYQCKGEILTREEAEYEKGIAPENYERWRDQKTPYTSLEIIKDRLSGYREMAEDQRRRKYSKRRVSC